MQLSLMYDGQSLGLVDFGPPDPASPLRHGRLIPAAAYVAARSDLQAAFRQIMDFTGVGQEEFRRQIGESLDPLTTRGLSLHDGNAPVSTKFLFVVDSYPPEADLEALAFVGISVSAAFADDLDS